MSTDQNTNPVNEQDLLTWVVLLCVKGKGGYGAFTCKMPYVPAVGQRVEFWGTPEGDFLGTVAKVTHAAKFTKLSSVEMPAGERFGMARLHDACFASQQEWQIRIEVTHSNELQEFGVNEL